MNSRWWLACICIAATTISTMCLAASPAVQRAISEIRPAYAPSDNMYLSYTALFNVRAHLRDRTKAAAIARFDLGVEHLNVLRAFLVTVEEGMSDAVRGAAFLQLDLGRLRAGYKKGSDLITTITPLAWSDDEVGAVAVFCHRFLNSEAHIRAAEAQVKDGNRNLLEAWASAQSFVEDPYVSSSSLAEYLQVVAKRANNDAKGLESFRLTSPTQYSEIFAFGAQWKEIPKVGWGDLGKRPIRFQDLIGAANRQLDSDELVLAKFFTITGRVSEKPSLMRDARSVDQVLSKYWIKPEESKQTIFTMQDRSTGQSSPQPLDERPIFYK